MFIGVEGREALPRRKGLDMIVEKDIKFRRLIPIIWRRMLIMFILSASIVLPLVYFDLKQFMIGMTTPLILGTAISIFLGFRTNSAYDRWFSGRDLFGQLCASTRNLALILSRVNDQYIDIETNKKSDKAAKVMPRMIRRAIAFVWMAGEQLKDGKPLEFENIETLLSAKEIAELESAHNPALALLFRQRSDFREAMKQHQLYDGEHFEFVAIHRQLVETLTACESLKNTPFPTHYTYFTDLFVWLLVILLSLSLPANESSGYYAIPLAVLIGWIFSMIEGIGDYMDYPWRHNRNVVPMEFMSRNLEIDLKALALGETDLPIPFGPKDGAIY